VLISNNHRLLLTTKTHPDPVLEKECSVDTKGDLIRCNKDDATKKIGQTDVAPSVCVWRPCSVASGYNHNRKT
jgi:hypothetical protein